MKFQTILKCCQAWSSFLSHTKAAPSPTPSEARPSDPLGARIHQSWAMEQLLDRTCVSREAPGSRSCTPHSELHQRWRNRVGIESRVRRLMLLKVNINPMAPQLLNRMVNPQTLHFSHAEMSIPCLLPRISQWHLSASESSMAPYYLYPIGWT